MSGSDTAASCRRINPSIFASCHISLFVIEQYETLPCLQLLTWKFPSGRFKEVVVIACCGRLVMERIVSGRPKEVSTRYLGEEL